MFAVFRIITSDFDKVSKVIVHKNLLSEEFCEIGRMEIIQKHGLYELLYTLPTFIFRFS